MSEITWKNGTGLDEIGPGRKGNCGKVGKRKRGDKNDENSVKGKDVKWEEKGKGSK